MFLYSTNQCNHCCLTAVSMDCNIKIIKVLINIITNYRSMSATCQIFIYFKRECDLFDKWYVIGLIYHILVRIF